MPSDLTISNRLRIRLNDHFVVDIELVMRMNVPGEDGEDGRLSVLSGREEQDHLLGDDGGIRGGAFHALAQEDLKGRDEGI